MEIITILFSVYDLWNILPQTHLEVWRDFVMACSHLCAPVISESRAILAHSYLIKFCQQFEELYGGDKVTPNMHLHTHLLDCVLDYGPVYAFWLFRFEKYNGILGDYGTNQRAVGIQLMQKFTSNQFMKDLPLLTAFEEIFKPLLNRLVSRQSGSLEDQSTTDQEHISLRVIQASRLSIGPVKKGHQWACTDFLKKCCGPFARDCIDVDILPHLRKCYGAMFDGLEESSVSIHFERYSYCMFHGDLFGLRKSRGYRSAFILARWCKLGESVDTTGSDLTPGAIDFFI